MSNSTKPVINTGEVELMDFASPEETFKARLGRMGPLLGAEKLGAMLTVVEPGKRAFPFHVHHAVEEMFYIIAGSGEYRFGKNKYPIRQGDLLSAPTGGAARAHQIINTGDTALTYLAISTVESVDAVEYPDSNKFLVFSSKDGSPQNAILRHIGYKTDAVEYFAGEE
ncbi:cupin domain-containing protein [Alteromonas halophila]|uniref:Cupin type-2 domain-containing protein n=1 Tax=Alteromonas halophila TaxID=516698 RepID=A0A918JDK4_9ALTE|nr:cupin domain-containing protein [Alteromonas halophila]GGW75745.1 hypothetical protein GCM10007391_05130 [Alteromonas halophila]